VQQTVEGEPLEIYPFLGSSRLEEPINTYHVSLVVHSHAHRGRLEGKTSTGVPVYNVSLPLLMRASAERPFRVFEIRVSDAQPAAPSTQPGTPPVPLHVPTDVEPSLERRAGERRH
jgi:hypothetical protein